MDDTNAQCPRDVDVTSDTQPTGTGHVASQLGVGDKAEELPPLPTGSVISVCQLNTRLAAIQHTIRHLSDQLAGVADDVTQLLQIAAAVTEGNAKAEGNTLAYDMIKTHYQHIVHDALMVAYIRSQAFVMPGASSHETYKQTVSDFFRSKWYRNTRRDISQTDISTLTTLAVFDTLGLLPQEKMYVYISRFTLLGETMEEASLAAMTIAAALAGNTVISEDNDLISATKAGLSRVVVALARLTYHDGGVVEAVLNDMGVGPSTKRTRAQSSSSLDPTFFAPATDDSNGEPIGKKTKVDNPRMETPISSLG